LLQQNIGGHFMVTTPASVSGQYFIRVQNKEYEANIRQEVSGISFMIQYRVLPKSDPNPLTGLDAESF
jgi:hypothetical protein